MDPEGGQKCKEKLEEAGNKNVKVAFISRAGHHCECPNSSVRVKTLLTSTLSVPRQPQGHEQTASFGTRQGMSLESCSLIYLVTLHSNLEWVLIIFYTRN
jgi:hypothetical protein